MKIYPDGTLEGFPEELAAFRHIDAAMTAKDLIMRKRSKSPAPPKKTLALTARKRSKRTSPAEIVAIVKDLDDGNGVTAAKVAQRMGIDTKKAYNQLYRSQTLGKLRNDEGRFKLAAAS